VELFSCQKEKESENNNLPRCSSSVSLCPFSFRLKEIQYLDKNSDFGGGVSLGTAFLDTGWARAMILMTRDDFPFTKDLHSLTTPPHPPRSPQPSPTTYMTNAQHNQAVTPPFPLLLLLLFLHSKRALNSSTDTTV